MRRIIILLGLTLVMLSGSVPAQAANTRYVWTACGPAQYRQIGPNDSRIMRFESCMRLHQVQDVLSGYWRTDRVTAHGEVQCKVNVPHTSEPIADRFRRGTSHSCSVDIVIGTNFVNGEEPGDGDRGDQWRVVDADGIWVRCVGDACSQVNDGWSHCIGSDAWHSRFDWIDAGLDGYRRWGVVAQSRSYEFWC